MTETTHYHLKKPAGNDFVGPGNFNDNADLIDAALHGLEEGKLEKDPLTGKLPEGMLPPDPADAKTTPVDADWVTLTDTQDSNARKKLTWDRIKATLKGYFDNLYAAAVHSHSWSAITGKPSTFSPSIHTHPASDLTTAVPVTKGGTGAVTAAGARENLGACALVAPVTVTLAVASWAGSGPWTQTATVSGVTASDNHIGVFPVDVADADARKLYEKAYGCLAAEAETVAGGVKFTCRDAKPETAFQVIIKGVR
ncbi:MAG: hypothetical protein ACLSE7_00815 [Lachnospirales bacterium]